MAYATSREWNDFVPIRSYMAEHDTINHNIQHEKVLSVMILNGDDFREKWFSDFPRTCRDIRVHGTMNFFQNTTTYATSFCHLYIVKLSKITRDLIIDQTVMAPMERLNRWTDQLMNGGDTILAHTSIETNFTDPNEENPNGVKTVSFDMKDTAVRNFKSTDSVEFVIWYGFHQGTGGEVVDMSIAYNVIMEGYVKYQKSQLLKYVD